MDHLREVEALQDPTGFVETTRHGKVFLCDSGGSGAPVSTECRGVQGGVAVVDMGVETPLYCGRPVLFTFFCRSRRVTKSG